MSKKKLSLIVMAAIIALSCGGLYCATQIKSVGVKVAFVGGPQFYPMAIFALLIILAITDIVSTLRKSDDSVIEIPNLRYLLFTVGMMILWVGMWKLAIGFYPATAICGGIMLYVLNPSHSRRKRIVTAVTVDAILTAFLYLVFSAAFFVNFG